MFAASLGARLAHSVARNTVKQTSLLTHLPLLPQRGPLTRYASSITTFPTRSPVLGPHSPYGTPTYPHTRAITTTLSNHPTMTSPFTISYRYGHFTRRKVIFNKKQGRQKKKYKRYQRRQMYKTWNTENLLRLMGERMGQRGARRAAKDQNRRKFMFNWFAGVTKKGRAQHYPNRRMKRNWKERFDHDSRIRKKPEDELGPDAVYKYKDTPHHVKFQHFGIHPRPIESNLVTGNEKVADRVLPPDYMDRIFNQEGAGKSIQERFQMEKHKLHYDINDYKRMGWKQRLIARLFHVAVPRLTEPLTVKNGTRRRLVGSSQIWVEGVWVDRREINDFLQSVGLYSCGVMTIHIGRLRLEAERLQGQSIHNKDGFIPIPMQQKQRIITDSDRTKRPQFELIEGTPRNPLLD